MEDVSSLYIHVPFCRYLCNYCDFFKYKLGKKGSPTWANFEHSLMRQWDEILSVRKNVSSVEMRTIYIGGGTPSLWGKRGMDFLSQFLEKNHLITNEKTHWTLEVDPGTCSLDEIKGWKQLGVNRFSVGLQTLDENYLKIADRVHTFQESLELLGMLRDLGLSFSADFLLGLPHSKGRNLEKELEKILSYGPTHLSLYILTVPQSYLHYESLPQDSEIEREYLFVSRYLKERGFSHYEVSNFAKEGEESRHNFIYWGGQSYWGLGVSATGQWRLGEKEMERYRWAVSGKRVVEYLGEKELDLEKLYLSLRTYRGFFEGEIKRSIVENWLKKNLVREVSRGHYQVTSEGFLIVDSMVREVF